MKKLLTLSLVALMSITIFTGCSSKEETSSDAKEVPAVQAPEKIQDTSALLKDGSYSVEGTANDKGWIPTADVIIQDGVITAITFDDKDASGALKSEAVANGEYDMTPNGAQASWTDEIATFSKAIIEGKVDVNAMTFDEKGKTDAVSGCTITIEPYAQLVKTALSQARM